MRKRTRGDRKWEERGYHHSVIIRGAKERRSGFKPVSYSILVKRELREKLLIHSVF